MRIFQKYFDKHWDCSFCCGQICFKTVPGGLWYVPVRMVWANGSGKFCRPRMTCLKILKISPILGKVALARWLLYFLHFADFDWAGLMQMNSHRFRSSWVELGQMLHMVWWHQACHWASRMSSCRHPDFWFLLFLDVPRIHADTSRKWLVETEIHLLSNSNTL